MKKLELLSPAGDMNKLKTAFYYGADAVYIGGKSMSLRALAGNFTDEEIVEAVNYAHSINKKVYVTVNIFGRNGDIEKAEKYFKFLESAKVDGTIISDTGLIYLARELSLKEIDEIHQKVPDIEIETFIHGAMCIAYSGRCLLSDYKTGRSSNRGACVQACRWNYEIREKGSNGEYLEMQEDERGTYIMNSKDLNLLDYIAELDKAGVVSFKIEGRMKSEYYLATVVNAYRRAIDEYYKLGSDYSENSLFQTELKKTAHRAFTTAYFLGDNDRTVNYDDSQSKGTHKFIANVLESNENKDYALVEMRNRFKIGDELEVLSPTESFNKTITVAKIADQNDKEIEDAKLVQQRLKLYTSVPLYAGDILRMKVQEN